MNIILRYYDSNGHNFGVMTIVPNLESAEHVFVALPDQDEKEIRAIAAYKKSWRVTLRSNDIAIWLRNNYHVGQQFSATLTVSDDGIEHHYSDITPIV